MNMKEWFQNMINSEKKVPMPVLSFPVTQLMGVSVREFISDSTLQAYGIRLAAQKSGSPIALSMMDLSVEAEAFGSTVQFSDTEVPVVRGSIAEEEADAYALQIPDIGAGRTGLYIEGVKKAVEIIHDRPVFAGVIGPFSLAGRLMDVNNALINCLEEPDMVHEVMKKATAFLIKYIEAYKAVGANGIVMAEPLTGLLSPALAEEFSEPYVREIIEAVQSDEFAVIYHNCGGEAVRMTESIASVGAMGYHFGNAVNLAEVLSKMPSDVPVLGNLNPVSLKECTAEEVAQQTKELMKACAGYSNFIPSTGCDVPPGARWENIHAFMDTVAEYYRQ